MGKIILMIIVCLFLSAITSCTPLTPEQQAYWRDAMPALIQQLNNQKMYDAQYNYYTRPYKVGDVIHIPYRR